MPLMYAHLSKRPHVFQRMTGLSVSDFEEIVHRVHPLWESCVEVLKKSAGRGCVLKSFEDKVMALLIYYRSYITHDVSFGLEIIIPLINNRIRELCLSKIALNTIPQTV